MFVFLNVTTNLSKFIFIDIFVSCKLLRFAKVISFIIIKYYQYRENKYQQKTLSTKSY